MKSESLHIIRICSRETYNFAPCTFLSQYLYILLQNIMIHDTNLEVYIQLAILSSKEESSTILDPYLLIAWQKKIQSPVIIFTIFSKL